MLSAVVTYFVLVRIDRVRLLPLSRFRYNSRRFNRIKTRRGKYLVKAVPSKDVVVVKKTYPPARSHFHGGIRILRDSFIFPKAHILYALIVPGKLLHRRSNGIILRPVRKTKLPVIVALRLYRFDHAKKPVPRSVVERHAYRKKRSVLPSPAVLPLLLPCGVVNRMFFYPRTVRNLI